MAKVDSSPPFELGEVPPAVVNIAPPEPLEALGELPWLRTLSLNALWQSCEHAVARADALAASIVGAKFARAALFALLAELLAIGSIVTVVLALIGLVYPRLVIWAVMNPSFGLDILLFSSAGVLLLAIAMVALHWLWALAMELGARHNRLPTQWRTGLCLASYSCGWDLVTSPLGVVLLLATRGRKSVLPTLRAALRAPRQCVLAYLEKGRGLASDERRRVVLFAAWLTGPVVLLFAAALLVGLVAVFA
jgi:hypothetical protein